MNVIEAETLHLESQNSPPVGLDGFFWSLLKLRGKIISGSEGTRMLLGGFICSSLFGRPVHHTVLPPLQRLTNQSRSLWPGEAGQSGERTVLHGLPGSPVL